MLAVTSHAENVFELHVILLDGSTLEAHHLHRETFEGEVTCLGLCNIGGRAHAVACLWRNNAVYLDLYSIQDKAHVKTIPMQSGKWEILSPSLSGEEYIKRYCRCFSLLALPFTHNNPSRTPRVGG